MRDFLEANIVESDSRQRDYYNKHSQDRKFAVGDGVWLSIPSARKLDPQWDGRWTITAVKGPLNMEISDGNISKVVHVNRLCHRVQPHLTGKSKLKDQPSDCSPPQVDHFTDFCFDPILPRRYPTRI